MVIFYLIIYGIILLIVCLWAVINVNKGYKPDLLYPWRFLFKIWAFLIAAAKALYEKPTDSNSKTALSRMLKKRGTEKNAIKKE